jgi:hypothetical protein
VLFSTFFAAHRFFFWLRWLHRLGAADSISLAVLFSAVKCLAALFLRGSLVFRSAAGVGRTVLLTRERIQEPKVRVNTCNHWGIQVIP